MGAEIDRLEVAVEAQASKANQQLDLLINKLLKVSNTLTGLNINGFSGMAAGVRNLSAAMKTMSGVKAADFTKTAKGIERLGGVNTSNFQNTAQNVRALADACIALSGVKAPQIDTNGITSLAKSMGTLSKIDGVNFAPVANGIKQVADSMAVLGGTSTKDTGINNTINALKRLVETKLDSFDPAIFSQITQSIAALGGVPDVSRNLNQFISSLSRLAAAGPATQQTANALPALAANLRAAITAVSGVGNISESVNMFVQSVGRLATAGNKTGQTAAQLDVLAQETLRFFRAMTQAPHISRNTIAMTQALAQLASAGGKVGTATGTVANAFRRLSSIGKSALSSMKKVASGIVSSFKRIGNSSGHINTATFSLRNLFRAVLPLLGIRQLFNWGKQAVEVASDLTEVQNVVDVTFGDMRDKANEFASTALRDFGLSELSAKDISSRFQAMGVAMGIESSAVSRASDFLKEHSALYGKTASSMADMSIELTKLTADMASLYNVDNQKDVADDLAAIFTGQTRPLRKYGLDLTQTTLQEWALTHGINANIQSMTQAEKTLLRYQYVMSNTSAAQGDFAATIGTWANQMRILRESVREMSSVIGGVLINTFKPLITWLNAVMLKVTSVVKTIANALGAIFGWTIELTPSQATSDYDDMADGIGGVGDAADAAGGSLGKATEKAKEFQRFLAGFDEIEKIPDESEAAGGSGGSGGGGGAGGVGGSADGGDAKLVRREGMLDMFESEIKTLEQLGSYIGETLAKAMKKIPWEDIYSTAENFGSGLASFLNGLIETPGLFTELGNTVASTLNTALHFLDSFGDTFEWDNFGNSLSEGINGFFETFDWKLTADTFDAFANGILDALVAATGKDGIKWEGIATKIGDSVKKALKGIEWDKAYEAAGNFGTGLADFMNKLITKDTFSEIGNTAAGAVSSVISGVKNWVTKSDFYGWGASLGTALKEFFDDITWEDVGLTLDGFFKGLVDFITGLVDTAPWEDIGYDIGNALSKVHWSTHLYNAGKALMKALGELLKGFADTPAGEIITGIAAAILGAKLALAGLKLATMTAVTPAITGGVSVGMAGAAGTLATIIGGGLIVAVGQVAVNELTGGPETAFQGLAEIVGGWFQRLGGSEWVQSGVNAFGNFMEGVFSFMGEKNPFTKENIEKNHKDEQPEIEAESSEKPDQGHGRDISQFIIPEDEFKTPDGGVITTPEIEGSDKEIKLPPLTHVKPVVIDGKINVTGVEDKRPKAKRVLDGLTVIAEKLAPGSGAALAGISATVDSVSKATGINSLKDLAASVQEVWKSGNPILKNVQATVSKTDRQTGSTLTVKDVNAQASAVAWAQNIAANAKNLVVSALTGGIGWTSDAGGAAKNLLVSALTGGIGWATGIASTAKNLLVSALTGGIGWTASASASAKNLSVSAKTSGIDWATGIASTAKNLLVSALTGGIGWTSDVGGTAKNLLVSALTGGIGWASTAGSNEKTLTGVAAKANGIDWQSGVAATAKALGSIAGKATGIGWAATATADNKKLGSIAGKATGISWSSSAGASVKKLSVTATVTGIEKGSNVRLALSGTVFGQGANKYGMTLQKAGGLFMNGSWRPITAYAGGGAPSMGQAFIAREAGPELVGTIGGHTAVMNNDQIVSSVSDGVYRAVAAAMAQSGGQSGVTPVINVYVGGKQVTDVVIEDINGRTMATGTCPILA